mmetsp:Transcript_18088/g.41932  ORF Transcript_18088/g.41932 Transcript_18088/m.41932 type:complete len:515 (+) Transcript_18088:59-1603(+)
MNDLVRHGALITFDLLSVFLFSGIVFGWAPLNSMLLQEGTFYASLCELGPDGQRQIPCDAQRAALNQAFTIASTAVSLVALPAGYFIDKKGPIWGVAVAGVLEVLGLIGVALCEDVGSGSFDLFLYSFTLISIAGAMTMFCGYTLPFVFPVYATLLVETTSCLFDGSCIIFLGFKVVYSAGMSFAGLWWSYAVLAVIIYSCLLASWAMCREELQASRAPLEEDPDVAAASPNDVMPADTIDKKPLGKQLLTFEFAAIFLYGTIQVSRSNLYLGTVDLYNDALWQAGKISMSSGQLTTLAGLIIPFGFVAVPIIEASVHHLGLVGTVHLTTAIGVSYAAVQILFSNDIMQLVGAGLFAVWRAYLFSIISAFVMSTFGAQTMGRIMGVCFLSAALVNLAQAPLVSWTLTSQDGNFIPLLTGAMLVCLPLPIPWFVLQWKQRRDQARAPLLSADSTAAVSHSDGSFPPPPTSWHGTALGTPRSIEVLQSIHRRSSVTEMNRQATERRASQQMAQVNA